MTYYSKATKDYSHEREAAMRHIDQLTDYLRLLKVFLQTRETIY